MFQCHTVISGPDALYSSTLTHMASDRSRPVNVRCKVMTVVIVEVAVHSEGHHDQATNPPCVRETMPRHQDEYSRVQRGEYPRNML